MEFCGEQLQLIKSDAPVARLESLAGCGKTTALKGFALARPNAEMLLLAFNKETVADGSSRMPSNVRCMTINGLAMQRIGHRFKHKLVDSIGLTMVTAALGLQKNDFKTASAVIKLLQSYLVSAKQEIRELIAPGARDADELRGHTVRLWRKMMDPQDTSIGMTHDGYLKLFQLEYPDLSDEFDYVMLDEYQDSNPVTIDIVTRQQCGRIYAGDQHQQIYQFRGATNAADAFQGSQYALTRSHRFGQDIADVANRVLHLKKASKMLIGGGPEGRVGRLSRGEPYALLCRTNAAVFAEAAALYANQKLYFIGGIENYRFEKIEDTYHLSLGQHDLIKDRKIQAFSSIDAMSAFAKDTSDVELGGLVRAVNDYGNRIPTLLAGIRESTVKEARNATVGISSVHKTKGREFNRVRLADDFFDIAKLTGPSAAKQQPIDIDAEINLLYVAITRAKHELQLSPSLTKTLT